VPVRGKKPLRLKRWSACALLGGVIGFAAWLAGCQTARTQIRKVPNPNVILISIDTCRADRLSCYGHPGKTTPNIDALAEQAVLFSEASSPVPMTLPAHASMLTGTIPPSNGVRHNDGYKLSAGDLTLAEILKERGYKTGAVISAFVLDSQFGLDQGFDFYDDVFEEKKENVHGGGVERRGEEVSRVAIRWLEENRDERFFLFIHYYDPHLEYDPPSPYDSTYRDDPYTGEVAYADHCIGAFLDKLKDLGLFDSALILVTGDHAESLHEHDEADHGFFIYQSSLRVPLVIKFPGQKEPRRVNERVGLVDLAPTILGYLDAPIPDTMDGEDLTVFLAADAGRGKEWQSLYYCESIEPTSYRCAPLQGVIDGDWKYIRTLKPELYNLAADPGEKTNLFESEPVEAARLDKELAAILETAERDLHGENQLTLGAESLARLENLGYIGSGAAGGRMEGEEYQEDAKDFIATLNETLRAKELDREGRFSEARAICQRILAQRPHLVSLHEALGSIAMHEGRMEEAASHFSTYLQKISEGAKEGRQIPAFDVEKALTNLAGVMLALGRLEEAAKQSEEALRLNPNSGLLHYNVGLVRHQQGRFDEAVERYEKALELDPNLDQARNALAAAKAKEKGPSAASPPKIDADSIEGLLMRAMQQFMAGKSEEALSLVETALKENPKELSPYPEMANALVRQGRPADAITLLSKVLQAFPDHPPSHYTIAFCYVRQGDVRQAIGHLRKTIQAAPDWAEPLMSLAWILATSDDDDIFNGKEAVELATRAVQLTPGEERYDLLDTLAAAYGAAGRFEEAQQTARRALEVIRRTGPPQAVQEAGERLKLYESRRPFRPSQPSR